MLKFFHRMLNNKKGFTLVELMVVIVIIGILATVGLQSFGSSTEKAKISKAKADIRTLMSALELYKMDNDQYPADLNTLVSSNYIKSLPKDPGGSNYNYTTTETNGKRTGYTITSTVNTTVGGSTILTSATIND